MNAFSGASAYKRVDRFGSIEGASPHQLTAMLMQGALKNIAIARGMMERKDFAGKAVAINKTIAIITELNGSLDMERGGEISVNLQIVYSYMLSVLLQATAKNSIEKLDEVSNLMDGLLQSWNTIPENERSKAA